MFSVMYSAYPEPKTALHLIPRQIQRCFGRNGKCSVSSLSPATPALSSVKFDLIFFPVLGYFPTEMKG